MSTSKKAKLELVASGGKGVAGPNNVGDHRPANDRERLSVEAQAVRRRKAKPLPRIVVENSPLSPPEVSVAHDDGATGFTLLMEAIGTANADFTHGMLGQICNVASKGRVVDESATNFAMSVIAGVQPRDEVESMLAAQMAAVHMATMTFARRMANVDTIAQQDSAERAFNKLARTFAAQIEALKRYRSKGEQRVIVERVTVNKGGQAVVGLVERGGGMTEKSAGNLMEKAHAAPRCRAKSKRSGERCKCAAVRGKNVCRMHGAYAGAPRGTAHGMYKHGRFTCEAIDARKQIANLVAEARRTAMAIE